jgi:hypothetical protein
VSFAVLSRVLLSAALALLPAPALADVTARYAMGKDVLTIEADDDGDWRVDVPGKFTLIHRGAIDYVVMQRGPEAMVFKLEDLVAMIKPDLQRTSGKNTEAFMQAKFVLKRGGDVEVAGYKGASWNLGLEVPTPKGRTLDVVTSKDPALAPIGAVFLAVQRHVAALAADQFTPESNFLALVGKLVESGTPLRMAPLVELRSVDGTAIDPKRFELPGPVIDSAILQAELATRAEGSEPAPDLPPLP